MSKRDYYEVLGVARTANEVELKASFRKLAMQHHPDRNPGDHEAELRFKEINEAYQVLADSQKRAAYDRFGHQAFAQGNGAGGPGFGPDFSDFMSDIFDTFFGDTRQRGRGQGRERGADRRADLEITLEESFKGKTAKLDIPTTMLCEKCSGSGAKPGSKPRSCATCHGHGRVRSTQGFFSIERACPTCHGRGQTIDNPCGACAGMGRVTRERSLSVNIPAGVEDGTRIRLAGEGDAGTLGAASGDLYLFLSVKPHPFYQRDGADLFCRVPISMTTAALGGDVTVPTLDGGQAKLHIPEGAQTGKQFRLRGKGMPVLRSRDFGDLHIQAVVETPQNLTRRQRELLMEFDKESSSATQPESSGFFAKVKDFFEGR
ncbi:MAG: molecular chaperone DnaJ [Hyphomicrobiales bacterium]|nr:molecular chaperone DnaJ [Hyphomicrobiales bacterium]